MFTTCRTKDWLSLVFAPHLVNASTHRVRARVRVSIKVRINVRVRDSVRFRLWLGLLSVYAV